MTKANSAKEDPYFQQFINIPLIRAGRLLQMTFTRDALVPHGLTVPQWRTLLFVERLRDSHPRAIARYGSLDPTHVSKAAVELERKGLVRRYDDATDQRRKRVAVTAKGSALIAEIWPQARALDAKVQAQLGPERYDALRAALGMILDMPELSAEAPSKSLAAE